MFSIKYVADTTGGTSMDWARGVAGIKYSFSLELRDKGQYGFMLPRNQIVPTGEETLTGLLAMANEIKKELWCTLNITRLNSTHCDNWIGVDKMVHGRSNEVKKSAFIYSSLIPL